MHSTNSDIDLGQFLEEDFADEFPEIDDPNGIIERDTPELESVLIPGINQTYGPRPNINYRPNINFGHGNLHWTFKNMPHLGQPYKNLNFYKRLGSPNFAWLKNVGKMYNEHFHREISLKQIPKFSRNHFRRSELAYFFIEDHKDIIIPWLKEIRMISHDF